MTTDALATLLALITVVVPAGFILRECIGAMRRRRSR